MDVKPLWNIILNACRLEGKVDKEVPDLAGFLTRQSIHTF